ncbi:hypothetical protein K8090_15760 [Halomonas meridiana]|uniref:hypothetical protein n=1 Tax=Vreelandella aquamarina TaxID=77097 RepID=UPI001E49BD4F|nr:MULTISPECIES: hypothetical protein [Halomonas]MCD1652494.1 hypothetical protein [Halomonas axialensis]MCD2089177.1 hypothetical protein [Halomonas meridiana]
MPSPLVLSPKECQEKTWHPPHVLNFVANKDFTVLLAGKIAKAAATMLLALSECRMQKVLFERYVNKTLI